MNRILFSILLTLSFTAFADESLSEKGSGSANTVKRAVKKGANRVKEMVCTKGDAACLAEKAKHRAQEAGDYVKDKAIETKDSVDSDGNAND